MDEGHCMTASMWLPQEKKCLLELCGRNAIWKQKLVVAEEIKKGSKRKYWKGKCVCP